MPAVKQLKLSNKSQEAHDGFEHVFFPNSGGKQKKINK